VAKVSRTSSDQNHRNTLVLRTIKIVFQRYPGLAGSDGERGIAGVAFNVLVNGILTSRAPGTTAADGSISLDIPGGAKVILEIFGTQYELIIRDSIEPVSTLRGQQRRLSMLGYEISVPVGRNQASAKLKDPVDGRLGARTDNGILNFQADNDLDTDGTVGRLTTAKLEEQVGEAIGE